MKVAVVGCGYWGKNYARVLTELDRVDAVAVCERDQGLLDAIGKRFPAIECTTDLEVVLGDTAVRGVIVVTPADTHHAVVERCLRAGKHVLVEKPLTLEARTATALVALAAEQSVRLMVGHTFLFNSKVHKLKALVSDAERFGKLYYLSARRTNMGPVRADTSVLWDLAPHDVSIFQYIMGGVMPTRVSATGQCVLGNDDREDVVFVTLFYPDRVVGHIHVSWVDPHKVREVFAVGSNQRIACDDMSAQEPVRVFEKGVSSEEREAEAAGAAGGFGDAQLTFRDGDIFIPKVLLSEPLKVQTEHFLDLMSEEGTVAVSGGMVRRRERGRRVVWPGVVGDRGGGG